MSKAITIANVGSAELFFAPMANVVDGAPKSGTKILATSHDRNSIVWVWERTVGSFIWHYGEGETVYIISGEVFISTKEWRGEAASRGRYGCLPWRRFLQMARHWPRKKI